MNGIMGPLIHGVMYFTLLITGFLAHFTIDFVVGFCMVNVVHFTNLKGKVPFFHVSKITVMFKTPLERDIHRKP